MPDTIFKATIKSAALLLLSDLGIMRKGELVAQLQTHMAATERGPHYLSVQESIKELQAEHKIKLISYKYGPAGEVRHLVMLPDVEFINPKPAQAEVSPDCSVTVFRYKSRDERLAFNTCGHVKCANREDAERQAKHFLDAGEYIELVDAGGIVLDQFEPKEMTAGA